MQKTVVFGTVFMDCQGFAAYRYDPVGRNVGSVKFFHGGVGRNAAENLASLGADVLFVSSVDDSALGREILDNLKHSGVDVSHVRPSPSAGMGLWLAIMDQNGNLASSISQMPDVSTLDDIVREEGDDLVKNASEIVLEMDIDEYITSTVISLAEKYGKKVYGITANMEIVLRCRDLLPSLECYICNEAEAGRLFDMPVSTEDPSKILSMLRDYVETNGLNSMIVTLGSAGSVFHRRGGAESGFVPSIPTQILDASGAGDAFFSGVTYALSRGKSLCDAARLGTKIASLTIEVKEPTRVPLPENELRDFLSEGRIE